jgi:hypothetical protein
VVVEDSMGDGSREAHPANANAAVMDATVAPRASSATADKAAP